LPTKFQSALKSLRLEKGPSTLKVCGMATQHDYRTTTGEGKGRRIYTFKTLNPVLLLPRKWRGDAGALTRGFEGRPVKTFFGGAGTLVSCSSSGVGGSSASMLRGFSSA
jgi:hypothetical protein